MPTKEELENENAELRRRLAAGGGERAANVPPRRPPWLSEGERQDLKQNGVINDPFRGGRTLTAETATEEFGSSDQVRELDVEPENDVARRNAEREANRPEIERAGIRGFDYVWPSVAPGVLDPEAAGTPGVSGPAEGDEDTD